MGTAEECGIFLLLLLAGGISLMGVGSSILYEENQGVENITNFSVGAFALSVGVVMIIAIFSFWSLKLHVISLVMLICIFILTLVLGILALVTASHSDGEVDRVVRALFDDYVNNQYNTSKKIAVDTFQQNFRCCGVEGSNYWVSSGLEYPSSCYAPAQKELYSTGCTSSFQESIIPKITAAGAISIVWAILEGIGIVIVVAFRFEELSEKADVCSYLAWRK